MTGYLLDANVFIQAKRSRFRTPAFGLDIRCMNPYDQGDRI